MTDTDEYPDYRTGPPPPTDALDTVDPKFIVCRVGVLGHSWKHISQTREGNLVVAKSRCTNCGTRRVKKFTVHGGLVGRPDYDYPEGYLTKKGKNIRKADNDGWRGRFIRNTLGNLG